MSPLVAVLALAVSTPWAPPPQGAPPGPTTAGARRAAESPPGSGAPTPDGGHGVSGLPSAVRLILEQPSPSPFSVVRYEVVQRGRATAVIQRRQIEGYSEPLHAMALLTRAEAARLGAALAETDARHLPDAPPPPVAPPGALRWRVELDLPHGAHVVRVTAPEAQPDRRYARLIRAVRGAVAAHTGPLPFRDVFFPASERGWLDVQSVPPARLHLDGVDVGLDTPVYGYEVPAGRHTVRLVSREPALDRTYSVVVARGGTTQIAVDLR